jgi:hypothetical protein
MTNPSPKTKSERAAHREEHNANTYFKQCILADTNNIGGRFAKEEASKIVGAGAKYPPAQGINNDAVVSAALNGPDATGVDLMAAPVVGAPHEIEAAAFRFTGGNRRELAQSADPDLASLSDSELLHRRRWAELAMKQTFEDTDKIDQCQAIIDAVDAEQRRRL